MITRIMSLLFILASMSMVVHLKIPVLAGPVPSTLTLGFLLLSAYCVATILERIHLPLITGYILAGLFLGPYFLQYYDQSAIANLEFINSLALAFIAFTAGGELRSGSLRKSLKSIGYLLSTATLIVFLGVTVTVFLLSPFIAFLAEETIAIRLAISSLFGVIAVARSPSSTIAIINETKAHGRFTEMVLGVTIATDVIIIICFAVVVSVSQLVVSPGAGFDVYFILFLFFEVVLAFVLGFLLGKAIVFLIDRVGVEFPIVIAAMGFFVIKFSHFLGGYLKTTHDISLNIEPLLICMAAGFTVQNFSDHGKAFLVRLNRLSMPIYVAFFAVTGASINVDVLKQSWLVGLVIVVVRILMLYFGSVVSGKLAKDPPKIYRNTWLAFITQAGVSLGLLAEVVRRFPEFGVSIQSVLVAAITLNQIVGPILFKYALYNVGEAHTSNLASLHKTKARESV
jgi:Kef-type K+ transport system membrane component KefB